MWSVSEHFCRPQLSKAPSTRIRINLKTDKYLSGFKFIRVHTLPFVNRFWCPHVNAKTIWKRWRRLLSMLFGAKHVPAVSRILSLNPLGCALGLLKLINSVRMARNPWQHGRHARASMSNSVLGYKRVAKSLQGKQCTFRLISIETRACLFAMFSLMVDRPRARVGLGLNCYVIVFKSFSNLSG